MHGVVHAEFRRYAMERVGHDRWRTLLAAADLPVEPYLLSATYPDEQFTGAVALLEEVTGEDTGAVLHAFGQHLFTGLITVYGDLVPPEWGALDLIERTENVIHRTLRLQDPSKAPPRLTAVRTREDEVHVVYASPRRLCALAHGVLAGAAAHFAEPVRITEERCHGRGDAACEFLVTRSSAPRA